MVDDFIRNFLRKAGLQDTLESFNREWFELQSRGQLKEEDITTVPGMSFTICTIDYQMVVTKFMKSLNLVLNLEFSDVYIRNAQLDEELKQLRVELQRQMQIAAKARVSCLYMHIFVV